MSGNRKRIFWISMPILLLSMYLLVTGSSLLTYSLHENFSLPFGNITTWLGFIALNTSIKTGLSALWQPAKRFHTVLSKILKMALVFAIFWVPIGYLLSGNLTFTFGVGNGFQGSQMAMKIFWGLNYGLVIVPVLILVVCWVSTFLKRFLTSDHQEW